MLERCLFPLCHPEECCIPLGSEAINEFAHGKNFCISSWKTLEICDSCAQTHEFMLTAALTLQNSMLCIFNRKIFDSEQQATKNIILHLVLIKLFMLVH